VHVSAVTVVERVRGYESIRGAVERSPERFPKLGPLGLIRCNSLVS
jgi:hypothetical protein